MAKMKKSEDGISLRKGQYKRLGRIAERNPERADIVAERMKKRDSRLQRGKEIANPRRMEMNKALLMKEKELNAPAKKAQNGKKTAFGMLSVKKGIDNNPNPTFADKIAGAKKKAMSGMEVMKNGGKKAAKQAAIAIAMKKAGKAPKKMMKNGGGILSAPKKDGLSMQLGSYKDIIGKNYTGKNTKAVGLTKAKYGKSVMKMGGKCKNGC
jgi:hypothetical protein